jgi:hypothetical protein
MNRSYYANNYIVFLFSYRKKPIYANIFSFGMECWYLALTLAFIISRLAKFMLTTTFYVGRIDVPVLAQGLLLDMDSLPKVRVADLAIHLCTFYPFLSW